MPRFILSDRADKSLQRLPANIGRQVLAKIEALPANPNPRGSRKVQGRPADDPMYRIYSGDYRIFYVKQGQDVHIIDVRHRQGAYKKRR